MCDEKTVELLVTSAATLVAAFAGAWAAFLLEASREKHTTKQRHVAAANRALYTIFNLWNVLSQFQKEVIKPIKGASDAWLNMSATFPSSHGLVSFQADELAFLLQTGHAGTYAELLLEEQRFGIAIRLIEERSSLVLNQVFPKLAAGGVPVGGSVPLPQLEHLLGTDVVHRLKQLTAGITQNVEEDIASLRAAYEKLREAMNMLYPKETLVRVEFDKAK